MIALSPPHNSQINNYTNWLKRIDMPYLVLNTGDVIDDKFSMLVLCGGPDIGKKGEEKRDSNEIKWFKQSYGKIPVLGICRGMQLVNVILGGDLYDDLKEIPVKHSSIINESTFLNESSFHDVSYDSKIFRVNSRHHQGIKKISDKLVPLGFCVDDNLVEIASGDNSLFVQWHPEREDVWGTDAEKIVSDWVAERVKKIDKYELALHRMKSYYYSKNFNTVSKETIAKNINIEYDEKFLYEMLDHMPDKIKQVLDKKGRKSIKLI